MYRPKILCLVTHTHLSSVICGQEVHSLNLFSVNTTEMSTTHMLKVQRLAVIFEASCIVHPVFHMKRKKKDEARTNSRIYVISICRYLYELNR